MTGRRRDLVADLDHAIAGIEKSIDAIRFGENMVIRVNDPLHLRGLLRSCRAYVLARRAEDEAKTPTEATDDGQRQAQRNPGEPDRS